MHRSRPSTRLPRAVATGAAISLAAALAPSVASARVGEPPAPRPIDEVCAEVPAGVLPFEDIDGGTFVGQIHCLHYSGITNGIGWGSVADPRDSFAPAAPVTRAEMASFLVRLSDLAVRLDTTRNAVALPDAAGTVPFTDVVAGGTHADAIGRLAAAGIAEGGPGNLPDREYGPALLVTRAQMASLVGRTLASLYPDVLPEAGDFFADDDDSVHEENIGAVAAAGIAVGDPDGRFRPGAEISREQMAAFLTRSLAFLEDAGRITPIDDGSGADPFPDGVLPAGMPGTWIGEDTDDRLVVVDTASGDVVRVLAEFDDPESIHDPVWWDSEEQGSFLGGFSVSADGATVYYGSCCERSGGPGQIHRVPVSGGTPELVTTGYDPAVSPDGTELAVVGVDYESIKVVDLATGNERRFTSTMAEPPWVRALSWSLDGRSLAYEMGPSTWIMVLDVATATSLADARIVAGPHNGDAQELPLFDAEGRLHLVRQDRNDLGSLVGPATAVVIDVADRSRLSEEPLGLAVESQDFEASGRSLARVHLDGVAVAYPAGGEPVDLATGYRAAGW